MPARSRARSRRRSCCASSPRASTPTGCSRWSCSIAPIYNADGNEHFATNNRGRQNGPVAGQGQRPNAQNYDLNRDHMKLDSPEARAFVKLMTDYDPQVGDGPAHHQRLAARLLPDLRAAAQSRRPTRRSSTCCARTGCPRSPRRSSPSTTGTTTTTATSRGATPSARGARSTTGRASTTATSGCATASPS